MTVLCINAIPYPMDTLPINLTEGECYEVVDSEVWDNKLWYGISSDLGYWYHADRFVLVSEKDELVNEKQLINAD